MLPPALRSRHRTSQLWIAGLLLHACLAISWADETPASGMAILIGVQDYSRVNDLGCSENDVDLMEKTLRIHCGCSRIIRLTGKSPKELQPTRGNLIGVLREQLNKANKLKLQQVFIYFAGHGRRSDDGSLYLLPSDCTVLDLQDTGLRVDRIRRWLDDCPDVQRKFLILDTCHAGETRNSNKGLSGVELAEPLRNTSGLLTFASCLPHQESIEWKQKRQGYFTYWFCRGLEGFADREVAGNGNGAVDTKELSDYVTHHVFTLTGQLQKPQTIKSKCWKGRVDLSRFPASDLPRERLKRIRSLARESWKYADQGNHRAAVETVNKAFEIAPFHHELFGLRANYRVAMRQSDRALEDIDRALLYLPSRRHSAKAVYLETQREALKQQGRYVDALKVAKEIIRRRPDSPRDRTALQQIQQRLDEQNKVKGK